MKPRIFVSSTYFDLKHVRERIERFIENYYFEPVLFESDNVFFEHNKPLDLSCYNEVKLCHMMILIIGGRYGSIVSGENSKSKKDLYDSDYVSITRKEFETAQKMNIPVFIFIDKNVYAEYHTYNKNKAFFDEQENLKTSENKFSFAHVDHVNVFKFINSVERIAIKTFEKIEDIEGYLQSQIASMLYLYLQELRDKKDEDKILDSVAELKNISKRMNEMLVAVGKNVIQDNTYQDVLFNQNIILIDFFIEQFYDNIEFKHDYDIPDSELDQVFNVAKKTIFNIENYSKFEQEKNGMQKFKFKQAVQTEFIEQLFLINENIHVERFNYFRIFNNYFSKIHPILDNDKNVEKYFDTKLKESLKNSIFSDLPF